MTQQYQFWELTLGEIKASKHKVVQKWMLTATIFVVVKIYKLSEYSLIEGKSNS